MDAWNSSIASFTAVHSDVASSRITAMALQEGCSSFDISKSKHRIIIPFRAKFTDQKHFFCL